MMLALMAEREQTRTLSRAKVRKIFQKIAFYEGVNTVSTQIFCFLSKEKRYIEDGNSPRKQLNFQVSHTLYTTDYKPLDYDLAIVLFSPQRREGAEALSLFEFIEHCHRTLRGRESRSTHTLCIDLGRVRRGWRTETSFMCFGLKLAAKPLRSLAKSKPVQRFDFIRALPKVSGKDPPPAPPV